MWHVDMDPNARRSISSPANVRQAGHSIEFCVSAANVHRKEWCYVDPANCSNVQDIGISTFFGYGALNIFYSYQVTTYLFELSAATHANPLVMLLP